ARRAGRGHRGGGGRGGARAGQRSRRRGGRGDGRVTGSLVRAAYGAGMTVAAMLAAIGAHLPGAKRRWPTLAGRLGKLPAPERAAAQGGDAIWLHAASVGELVAVRPLLARLRERFPGRVFVVSTLTGTGPAPPPAEIAQLGAALAGRRLIVGGSTHRGEDEALLDAYRALVTAHPDVVLLLAPRHRERVAAVESVVTSAGLPCLRYSRLAAGRVVLPP